jgi:hypothetical protein
MNSEATNYVQDELCAGQGAIDALCPTVLEQGDVHVRTPSDSPAAASRDTHGDFCCSYLASCTTLLNIGRIDYSWLVFS